MLLCLAVLSWGARAQTEVLSYEAEWRLLRAGVADVTWTGTRQAELKLRTVGLVSKLVHVENLYQANYDAGQCAVSARMISIEGGRHREADAAYDKEGKKATYLERDTRKDTVVKRAEVETPGCVYDVMGALRALRGMKLEPGQSLRLPVSDGKKFIQARVECLNRETVRTKAGTFQTVRCEAFLLSGELYGRKGRLFVWISEGEPRLPVQLRVQMPFYIGTVTLTLEKVETR